MNHDSSQFNSISGVILGSVTMTENHVACEYSRPLMDVMRRPPLRPLGLRSFHLVVIPALNGNPVCAVIRADERTGAGAAAYRNALTASEEAPIDPSPSPKSPLSAQPN